MDAEQLKALRFQANEQAYIFDANREPPKKFHHYDDCVMCLSGYICHDSTAHPNYMLQHPRPKSEGPWWRRLWRVIRENW